MLSKQNFEIQLMMKKSKKVVRCFDVITCSLILTLHYSFPIFYFNNLLFVISHQEHCVYIESNDIVINLKFVGSIHEITFLKYCQLIKVIRV